MSPASEHKTTAQAAQKRKRKPGSEAKRKKATVAQERSHSSSEAPSDGESDLLDGQTVDCDLEFYDPSTRDETGLRDLLRPLLDGADLDLDELVTTLIQQATVGTVIKTAEDEDPLGLISVLNLETHRQLQCLRQIRAFLQRGCSDEIQISRLEEAWGQARTGLVVSERVYNCPPQLAPPLQQALFDEIQWAVEDEPSKAVQDSFRFDQYVMITRAFVTSSAALQPTNKPGKKKKKAGKVLADVVYMRPEDEYYHKHCSWSFAFAVPNRPAGYEDLDQVRLCMLLTSAQVAAARSELDRVVGNMAAGI
ncbi:hypothetical protein WJX73_010128 [Symbiochloris irregularis]|uniref:Protein BCCIP homolog n=1 Tax=Symbiochloris irregularis TaxID=706552 RepID=A0AAW1PAA0_9CHLO